MSPNHLIALLNVYRGTPQGHEAQELRLLAASGLITNTFEPPMCTERGRIFVEHLKNLSLPVQTWGMPK